MTRRRTKIICRSGGGLVALAAGLFCAVAAAVAAPETNANDGKNNAWEARSHPSAPRELAPSRHAQELLRRAENTRWSRELRAASDYVSRRRRLQTGESRTDQEQQPQLRRKLPRGQGQQGTLNDYLPEGDPETVQILDGGSSSCMSPLQRWFVSIIDNMGYDLWEEMEAHNVTSVAYLYKHYVSEADGTEEYFGVYGDRTAEMKVNHDSLRGFWTKGEAEGQRQQASQYSSSSSSSAFNSPRASGGSAGVVLLGMHGADLVEYSKLVPTLQQLYGLDMSTAFDMADTITSIIARLPGAFNNPMLSANAIAIRSLTQVAGTFAGASSRDTILVGDGVFSFLDWLGLDPDGPDYIHAHEFGHHLQYDLGLSLDDVNTGNGVSEAEKTRRFEMMADALGSYYLGHKSGAGMDASRLYEVHRAAYSLGDCEDVDATHHGTPRQRECASNFGANLALPSYVDGGYVIPPREFVRLFDIELGRMLNLDEGTCEAVVDASVLDQNIYGTASGEGAEDQVVQQQVESPVAPSGQTVNGSGGLPSHWNDASNSVPPVNEIVETARAPAPSSTSTTTPASGNNGNGTNTTGIEGDEDWFGGGDIWFGNTREEEEEDEGWFAEGQKWLGMTKKDDDSSALGFGVSFPVVVAASVACLSWA